MDNFHKSVLDNGIRVISESMHSVRSVSLGIWVRAGTVNEVAYNNGISHFLEHMLFKGTVHRSACDIAASLEAFGGSLNGSTGKEISLYNAHILDEHVSQAVDVLSDMIQNPLFLETDLRVEKDVVLSEISQAREDPEEMITDYFYQNMFPDHPLGSFIYGTEENVRNFNSSDLFNYLTRQYTTPRIVFAAAGNVRHEHLVDLVQSHFSKSIADLPNQIDPIRKNPLEFNNAHSPHLFQGHFIIGSRIMGYHDKDKYAMSLLDILLGGGMSSRLFQNIREKYGYIYSIYSFVDYMANTGVFGVYSASPLEKLEKTMQLVHDELDKLCEGTVLPDELEQIKSQVRGAMLLGHENSARRMRRIGENEVYNSTYTGLEQILEIIEQITPDDITTLARRYLNKRNRSITLLTP